MPRKKVIKEENVKETVKETTVKVEPKEEKATPKVNKIRKIDREDIVEVMNNTLGNLVYSHPRTLNPLDMYNYGDIDTLSVQDLMIMKASQPRMLTEGWLIILDEDVVKYLQLDKLYKNIITPQNIESFFKLNEEEMKDRLKKMPRSMQMTVGKFVKHKIETGELDSIRKQQVVEEVLGVKLFE